MKLIIEIDLDASDLQEGEVDDFLKESEEASSLRVEVGREIEEGSSAMRIVDVASSYFKVRTEP